MEVMAHQTTSSCQYQPITLSQVSRHRSFCSSSLLLKKRANRYPHSLHPIFLLPKWQNAHSGISVSEYMILKLRCDRINYTRSRGMHTLVALWPTDYFSLISQNQCPILAKSANPMVRNSIRGKECILSPVPEKKQVIKQPKEY